MDLRGFNVYKIEPGDTVLCDFCGDDWTNKTGSGGFLFQSKAVCPKCSPTHLEAIKKYGEGHLIRGECPEEMSFADWIRSFRLSQVS